MNRNECNVLVHFAGDSVDLMSWFLNALHQALGGTKKRSSSIISKIFRGKMRVSSRKVPSVDLVSVSSVCRGALMMSTELLCVSRKRAKLGSC